MTVRGYPFDTTDPAGSVTELEWRRLVQWVTPSGVLRGEDNELLVSPRAAGANMSVDVATGCAFLVGHYVRSDAVASVAVGVNLTGNPRIDTIVVGIDFVANTASIYNVPGAVAVAPAPAALTQDITSKWEEALAYVYVAAGENVSITAPEMSDCRHFAEPQAQDLEQVTRLATTAALAASTITGVDRVANANGALGNIDGVAPVVGDRILDKDHATGSARGLWRIIDLGSASKPWRMRRSYAGDTSAKIRAMLMVRVSEGTANGNTVWLLTTDDPIILGTTALTFTQFGVSSGLVNLWLPAGAFGIALNTPTNALIASGYGSGWSFADAAQQGIAANMIVPTGWATVDIDMWWVNMASTVGNVTWDLYVDNDADGTAVGGGANLGSTVAAPVTAAVLKKSTMTTGVAVTPGNLLNIAIDRNGNGGSDTLTNNAAIVGVNIRKAS